MFAAGSRASLTEPGPVYTASEEQWRLSLRFGATAWFRLSPSASPSVALSLLLQMLTRWEADGVLVALWK